jgi:hypothetical protein
MRANEIQRLAVADGLHRANKHFSMPLGIGLNCQTKPNKQCALLKTRPIDLANSHKHISALDSSLQIEPLCRWRPAYMAGQISFVFSKHPKPLYKVTAAL